MALHTKHYRRFFPLSYCLLLSLLLLLSVCHGKVLFLLQSTSQTSLPPLQNNDNNNYLSCNWQIIPRGGSDPQSQQHDNNDNEKDITISNLIEDLQNQQKNQNNKIIDKNQQQSIGTQWRKLGKLLLDANEHAEAYRVFCHGATLYPNDTSLSHYLRVYNTFHGPMQEIENDSINDTINNFTNDEKANLPKLYIADTSSSSLSTLDLFATFPVPSSAVPPLITKVFQQQQQSTLLFSPTHIVHASKDPILSSEACSYIINAAKIAAKRRGGWTMDRHVHAPTCDIPVHELDIQTRQWIRTELIENILYPHLSKLFFNVPIDLLRIQDCFIVRYDGKQQQQQKQNNHTNNVGYSSLRAHQDESLISLTIALNDMNEYSGGGLFILPTGDLLNGNAGTVLAFAGGIPHGGYPVENGTRWIMTMFLRLDQNYNDNKSKQPGYVLEQILGSNNNDDKHQDEENRDKLRNNE